jgi:ankyrin repeat protein
MKKTIIYLGLALVAFSNVTMASTVESTSHKFELVKTYKSPTPLGVAISKGDIEAAKKFIEYGAGINEKSNGMTPLMIAARYNNVEIIKLLLEKGADWKAKDEKGFNAVKYAELSNAKEALDYLKVACQKA